MSHLFCAIATISILLPMFVYAGRNPCPTQIPNMEFLVGLGINNPVKVESGIVDGQFTVDQTRTGPARMQHEEDAEMVEIERIWGLGSKKIQPKNVPGVLRAVHIALYLKTDRVEGVRFWSMGLQPQKDSVVIDLLKDSEQKFFLDGKEIPAPGSEPLLVSTPASVGWRTLTLAWKEPVKIDPTSHLEFYARTIFHKPWLLKNLATGTRIDSCVYFIFE